MTEPLEASVTLEEVFSVVGARRVPLAPELAGYLALEIAEGAGKAVGGLDPKSIYVGQEGTVAIVHKDIPGDAETSVREILTRLLDATGSMTPALGAAARKKPGTGLGALVEELEAALIPVNRAAGRRALARLAREVKRVSMGVGRNAIAPLSDHFPSEAARSERPPPAAQVFDSEEVPTTARRDIPAEVLADAMASSSDPPIGPHSHDFPSDIPTVGISAGELEAARARGRRDSVDSLLDKFEVSEKREDAAVARDLKQMAGLEPTPPPPGDLSRKSAAEIEALLGAPPPSDPKPSDTKPDGFKPRNSSRPPPLASPAAPPAAAKRKRDPRPSYADDRQMPTAPSQLKQREVLASVSTEILRAQRRKRNIPIILLALLLLALVSAVVLWMVKPGFLTGRTPDKIEEERRQAEIDKKKPVVVPVVCRGSLLVVDAPKEAEVLVRVGQAPVDVDKMPVGASLEFVATAEGYIPKRAAIPGGAAWEMQTGKPRWDLAIQLDKSRAKPGKEDPWPPGDPGSDVGNSSAKASLGTVHVITTPKGAEVWLLVALGADARVEDYFACDVDADILLAGPTTYRKRMHIKASQFVPDPSGKPGVRLARVSAK